MKNKVLYIVLIVATLGVAAIFLYRKMAKRNLTDETPTKESYPYGFPTLPIILHSDITGVAVTTKNLGNIRVSNDNWLGKSGEYKGFVVFENWTYGVRAMIKNLITYYDKHKLRTIRSIISRYAPPSENNTENYIKFVSESLGIAADQALSLKDILKITPYMIRVEVSISDANMPYLIDYVSRVNAYFKLL